MQRGGHNLPDGGKPGQIREIAMELHVQDQGALGVTARATSVTHEMSTPIATWTPCARVVI